MKKSIDNSSERRKLLSKAELKRRALSVIGKYSSGADDVSENHDAYLTDAYAAFGETHQVSKVQSASPTS